MQYVYDNYDEILYTFNDNIALNKIYETIDKNTFLKSDIHFNGNRFTKTNDFIEMMAYLIRKLSTANQLCNANAINSMRNINIAMKELLDSIEKFIMENEKH